MHASPVKPSDFDWTEHYPNVEQPVVEFADIGTDGSPVHPIQHWKHAPSTQRGSLGCGYGGLLVALSPLFPNTMMLGMEIRIKVEAYVKQRIQALREQHAADGAHSYQNISVMRMNAMKFLPNFFAKGQVTPRTGCSRGKSTMLPARRPAAS